MYICPKQAAYKEALPMRQAGIYSGIMSGGRMGPHSLPLSRIKKIMKQSGEEGKLISCEAPLVFSKACELFIQELTARAYKVTVQGKRRTLQKEDIATAIAATDVFDFLVDMVSVPHSARPAPVSPYGVVVVKK